MKLELSCLSALDELLHGVYVEGLPSLDNCDQRKELVRTFHVLAREVYGCNDDFPVVEAYGSFIMDMFSNTSDLDLSVNFSDDPAELPRLEKVKALRKFKTKLFQLQQKGRLSGVEPILTAKVPILRAVDRQTGIECDISVENKDGILKSQFVLIVSEIDERFQKLSLLMKAWAKANDINSSKDRTLNSISLILLVAFHLQTREPPIFPPFSVLLKDGIKPENVKKVVQEHLQYGKENKESVAELFATLLSKLASVEDKWRDGFCVSTYEGSWITKTWDSKVGSISVEDFMDRTQNVARAVGPDQVEVIYECINNSMLHLWDFAEGRIQGYELKEALFLVKKDSDEYKRSQDMELLTFAPSKMSKRERRAAKKALREEEQALLEEEQAVKNTVDFAVMEEGKDAIDFSVKVKDEKTVDPVVMENEERKTTLLLPRKMKMTKRERRIARKNQLTAEQVMKAHDSVVTEKKERIFDSVVTERRKSAADYKGRLIREQILAVQRAKGVGIERNEPVHPKNPSFPIPGFGYGSQHLISNVELSRSILQPSPTHTSPSPNAGHSLSPSQSSPVHMFRRPLPEAIRLWNFVTAQPPVPQFLPPASVVPYGGAHQFWEHSQSPVAMHPPPNGGGHQFWEHSPQPVAMHPPPNGGGHQSWERSPQPVTMHPPPLGGGHQFWEHSPQPVAMHPPPNGGGHQSWERSSQPVTMHPPPNGGGHQSWERSPQPVTMHPPPNGGGGHQFWEHSQLPYATHRAPNGVGLPQAPISPPSSHVLPPQMNSLTTQNHYQTQAAPFHPNHHSNRYM